MIAGAVGMVGYCITASVLLGRYGAVAGSALAWLVWLAVAAATYLVFLR